MLSCFCQMSTKPNTTHSWERVAAPRPPGEGPGEGYFAFSAIQRYVRGSPSSTGTPARQPRSWSLAVARQECFTSPGRASAWRTPGAHVEGAVVRGAGGPEARVGHGEVRLHHVGDEDVVARLLPVAEDGERRALQELRGEDGHHARLAVRVLARAVDVGVAE